MSTPRPKNLQDRLDDLARRCRILERASRLNSASIGEGGIRIRDGGRLTIEGGGGIDVNDSGSIRARYENGMNALYFGRLLTEGGEAFFGHGLLHSNSEGRSMFWVAERPDGETQIQIGTANGIETQHVRIWGREDVRIDTSAGPVQINSSGNAQFQANGGTATVHGENGLMLTTNGDQVQIGLNASAVFIGPDNTSSEPPTARLLPNGNLLRSTSSARYKQDITDTTLDTDPVLRLRPRTWRDRAEVEADENCDRWHVGYVAEELDEIGMGRFVSYDDEGRPDMVHYDRLTVALVEVIKKQDARLTALEQAILGTDEGNNP